MVSCTWRSLLARFLDCFLACPPPALCGPNTALRHVHSRRRHCRQLSIQPAATQGAMVTITAGSEFQALFQSHENWLQDIKSRQEETFGVLNKSLNALGERMANAHEKSSEVVRRLTALDGLIDEGRSFRGLDVKDESEGEILSPAYFPFLSLSLNPPLNSRTCSSCSTRQSGASGRSDSRWRRGR